MNRAVIYSRFGGPDVLELKEVPLVEPGPGEIRVRVNAAGLNPMDWGLVAHPEIASAFGISLPSGFGSDYSGVVDAVGRSADGFVPGDRVFGNAIGHAVADHIIVPVPNSRLWRTPAEVDDLVAATLTVAGLTASAALDAIGLTRGDTVLVGGAAGGVGVFAVQLARLAGASVIGTASSSTFAFLSSLGARPVQYGPGLAMRVADVAPGGVSAAVDLFGTEAVEAAIALGVPVARIAVVAAGAVVPAGVIRTGAADASVGAMPEILRSLLNGSLRVPIAAQFPLERFREAVALQADRHTHGKIVITFGEERSTS